MIFLAAIKDKQLKFSVTIPMTYIQYTYNLYIDLSVCQSCFLRFKRYFKGLLDLLGVLHFLFLIYIAMRTKHLLYNLLYLFVHSMIFLGCLDTGILVYLSLP